ncbi:MAG: glycoside hydrolase family 2 protein [Pirellulales bacterium]
MMSLIRTLAAAGVLLAIGSMAHGQWKPADGPLMTRWAKDVSPEKVHSEYPRPQMARPNWMNLNGLWQYAEAKEGEEPPAGKQLAGKILVPFPIESALSGVMKQADRLWYRRTFTAPKTQPGGHVLLHFGAVDWEATVYLNGKQLGVHRGGYDGFSFDITDALKKDGSQELIVGVFDPTDSGDQPRGKQVHKPGGIMYTPTTGIWQTVWLEEVPASHITGLVSTPDVDSKSLRLKVDASGDAAGLAVRAVAADSGRDIATATGKVGEEVRIVLPAVKLWSPSEPFLYDLRVELVRDGKAVDTVASYFGMRKIEIGKDAAGLPRILLNGKFVMQVGPLDQGFWPDGLYTAPTDEALRFDIEVTKKLGFNMARKHVKVEPDRWYYWADRLGLLVWQDMPSGNNRTAESKKQYEVELARLIEGRRNHPSIIMWVVFNEGWGQYDTERLTAWTKATDPSRLANNASGWTDKKVGDMNDMHAYPGPNAPKAEAERAIVLGEFGGLGLAVPGHMWKKEFWGYQGMADANQLTRRYEELLQGVYKLKDSPGLSAAVYTQTTDVEVECNGLLTYDRAVIKPDAARVAAVNQGDFSKVPPPPVIKPVVSTSEEQPQEWRYTLEKPGEGWMKPGFDDAAWKKGPGGFGTAGTPGSAVNTEWKTSDIWLRREVDVPDAKFASLQLRIHHDEDAQVYINGVLAARCSGFVTRYGEQPISAEARAAIKPGKNTIAVHCRQVQGGQFIDVGLVDVVPAQK